MPYAPNHKILPSHKIMFYTSVKQYIRTHRNTELIIDVHVHYLSFVIPCSLKGKGRFVNGWFVNILPPLKFPSLPGYLSSSLNPSSLPPSLSLSPLPSRQINTRPHIVLDYPSIRRVDGSLHKPLRATNFMMTNII